MLAGTDSIVIDPEVLDHPWIVYTLVGVGIAGIVLWFFRRETGAFGEWLGRMRRAAEEREDTRVEGMAKDILYLKDKDRDKGKRIDALEQTLTEIRAERDALVNYLREWWHWALTGAVGAPPSVPEDLHELLPPSSWTWRSGHVHPQGQAHPTHDPGDG